MHEPEVNAIKNATRVCTNRVLLWITPSQKRIGYTTISEKDDSSEERQNNDSCIYVFLRESYTAFVLLWMRSIKQDGTYNSREQGRGICVRLESSLLSVFHASSRTYNLPPTSADTHILPLPRTYLFLPIKVSLNEKINSQNKTNDNAMQKFEIS